MGDKTLTVTLLEGTLPVDQNSGRPGGNRYGEDLAYFRGENTLA